MNKEMLRTKKLLLFLGSVVGIGFILGLLFISILSDENKELIRSSITSFFEMINTNKINYLKEFVSDCSSNLGISLIIWLIGISIIGIFIVTGVIFFKSFIIGFSFSSIIYTLGFKGILLAIIYIIPEIISLFIMFILVYYAISFSIILFNYLFKKKEIVRTVIMRRYIKVLVIVGMGTILNSLLRVLVIPNLLKLF